MMNANITLPSSQLNKFNTLSKKIGPAGISGHNQNPWALGRKPGPQISSRIFPMRKENFKLGFLTKLAEVGVSPTEFFDMLKQSFIDPMGALEKGLGLAGSAVSQGADLASTGLQTAGAAALAAPLVVGGATGALRELLETPMPEDVELLRRMEQLGLYRRLTNEIKNRMAAKGVA